MKHPNGYGTVFKLAGQRRKPYAVCVTIGRKPDGKLERKYIGYFPTRREAISALAAYNDNPFDVRARDTTPSSLRRECSAWERPPMFRLRSTFEAIDRF